MSLEGSQAVTWIQVQKPTFDLVGVVLYSFGLAGIMAGIALVLGIVLGLTLIRRRRAADSSVLELSLHISLPRS